MIVEGVQNPIFIPIQVRKDENLSPRFRICLEACSSLTTTYTAHHYFPSAVG